MKKMTYFFPKSVIYSFVNFQEKKDRVVISNTKFWDILSCIEHFVMSAL